MGQENKWKYTIVGELGRGDSLASPRDLGCERIQNSIGMSLAEMPNSGEMEPEEAISRTEIWPPVEAWDHLAIFKILTQNCYCLNEKQGLKWSTS